MASVIGRTVPFAAAARRHRARRGDRAGRRAAPAAGRGVPVRDARVPRAGVHLQARPHPGRRVRARRARTVAARSTPASWTRSSSAYPDRLGEHVERLAYHAVRGELWAAAVRYSPAGRAPRPSTARRTARRRRRSRRRWPRWRACPSSRRDAGRGDRHPPGALRSALLQLGEMPRIDRYLREAEALATALGDRRRLAWVWTYMTIAHLFAGDPGEALEGRRARAGARRRGRRRRAAAPRRARRWPTRAASAATIAARSRSTARRSSALAGDLVRERLGQADAARPCTRAASPRSAWPSWASSPRPSGSRRSRPRSRAALDCRSASRWPAWRSATPR